MTANYDPRDPYAQQPPDQGAPPQRPPTGGRQPPQTRESVGQPPQSGYQEAQSVPWGQPGEPQQFGSAPRQSASGPSPVAQAPAPVTQAPSPVVQAPPPGATRARPPTQQVSAQQPRQPRQPLLRPVSIGEIAAGEVVTVQSDTPVRTAVASMAQQDVGSVVVVENGEPIGLLTDRTVALALEGTPDVAQRTAGELASGGLVTADTSTSVFAAIEVMADNGIRRLPVVDEDGILQAIVTLDDVITLLATGLGNAAAAIEAQIDRL